MKINLASIESEVTSITEELLVLSNRVNALNQYLAKIKEQK